MNSIDSESYFEVYHKEIDGNTIYLRKNTIDPLLFEDIYIKNEYKIHNIFNNNDIVIDLGSHIGSFSLLCHKLGSRRIHSYEYNKENYNILDLNTKDKNIFIENKVVWRSDDNEDKFYELDNCYDYNRYRCSNLITTAVYDVIYNNEHTNIEVNKIGLDEIIDGLLKKYKKKRIKLLKIDVEGSEFPILYTSKLLNRVDIVIGEIHEIGESGEYNYKYWYNRFREIPDKLNNLGVNGYSYKDLLNFLNTNKFNVTCEKIDKHIYLFWAFNDKKCI